jgi:hypothetical protein
MRLIILLAFTILTQPLLAMTMGEAINEAGRQRMLSQKMAKAYLMAAITPDSVSAAKQMESSLYRFQYNHQALQNYADATAIRSALTPVETTWTRYQTALKKPPTAANTEVVIGLSEQLLKQTNAYVTSLQQLAGTPAAELVNVAGRQRMLSQRMTKYFLLGYWQGEQIADDNPFYSNLAEYENALNYLLQSPQNTAEIDAKLKRVKGQLDFANKAFDGGLNVSGDRVIFMVTGTTDAMLRQMNEVTALYARL